MRLPKSWDVFQHAHILKDNHTSQGRNTVGVQVHGDFVQKMQNRKA